jgi:hypothetical protein
MACRTVPLILNIGKIEDLTVSQIVIQFFEVRKYRVTFYLTRGRIAVNPEVK